MAHICVSARGRTGSLLVDQARGVGHTVSLLDELDDPALLRSKLQGADGVILIPRRGHEGRTQQTTLRLIDAIRTAARSAHFVLVTSFAVGHGLAHPLNRLGNAFAARCAAESELHASHVAWTILRPTWLTNDPPGAHAITLTTDPQADGMLARADLAAACLAALANREARSVTCAVFNEPGRPVGDWAGAFARAKTDGRGMA
jgi:uncharacterized protein YbjT (DUF2867 family)